MKSHISAALAAALVILPAGARAQWVVTDPGHTAQSIAGWTQQAKDALAQLKEAQRHYAMFERQYAAISGARDMGDMANALGGATRHALPETSEVLRGIGGMYGAAQGGVSLGTAGRLLNGADRFLQGDRAYRGQVVPGSPASERWHAEMDRREAITANAKAVAAQGLADMEERIYALANAERQLSTSPDLQSVALAQGVIATSQANLAAHQNSIASVQLMLQAEDRTERQRGEQAQAESAASWEANTRAAMQALRGE